MPAQSSTSAGSPTISVVGPDRAGWLAVLSGWMVAVVCFAISPPYGAAPLVALATALLWWLAVVVVVRSDLSDFIIPDGASAAIALLGLLQAVAIPVASRGSWAEGWLAGVWALGNGAGAFALFWLVGALFGRFGKREALGFGDVKLAGASAVWLAPDAAALALEIAALGAIAALLIARRRAGWRDAAVPFGAFLAPAAWLVYVASPVARTALPW